MQTQVKSGAPEPQPGTFDAQQCEREYRSSPALQGEFGSFERYRAYRLAEANGQVRRYAPGAEA